MKKVFLVCWIAATSVLLLSCKDKDDNTPGKYPFAVRLTDAPGDYESVNIDVKSVLVNTSGTANDNDNSWTTLSTNARMYDLVRLTNGKDTLLADATLPYGKVSQIRLILGDKNTLVKDGKTYDIKTPSAQQSGLKIKVNETLTEGVTYVVTLDFDASRSIVEKGNGDYSLKPVIRAFTTATSGAIKGMVSPAGTAANVYAITGTDTFGTMTNSNGSFLIGGLQPNTYNVVFKVPSMNNKMINKSATVTMGQSTDMGTIDLTK
ncbi:MAG: DUF4382 domain-containing protein [Sphingobacteriales bacterium]|nr:MAG: DUF4382 domain-containing protein [Sphingobacteriales bacterium]